MLPAVKLWPSLHDLCDDYDTIFRSWINETVDVVCRLNIIIIKEIKLE